MLDIFVPSPSRRLVARIAPRLAIVALTTPPVDHAPDSIHIYFEGNLFGACNMQTFSERVLVAGFRCRDGAPTAAASFVSPEDLLLVARFDLQTRNFTEILEPAALAAWVSPEPVPIVGTPPELISPPRRLAGDSKRCIS